MRPVIHALVDTQEVMEEVIDEDEYSSPRAYGYSRPTRRCTSAPPGGNHPKGLFFPNYKTSCGSIVLPDISRPTVKSGLRDQSLDASFNVNIQGKVNTLLKATGLVYVGSGDPGVLDGSRRWDESCVGTFWLLEQNGHLVGVTALHLFASSKQVHIYINKTELGNNKAERAHFQRQEVELGDFVEVHLREDLLAIRAKYIRELGKTHDATKEMENIDPDFGLQYAPVCDVAFLDLEPHKDLFKLVPKFKLAPSMPVAGDMDLLVGYNYAGPWKVKELDDEFFASVKPPPASELYFSDYRSVSLGKVQKVGTGIITDISTSEEMSSGGPKLCIKDGELYVFGISVGSYYDKQDVAPPADWTIIEDSTNPLLVGIQLPEANVGKDGAKNRNLIISINHSCVKLMFASI